MKKLRYFLMMFLTVAACAGFQSCSDDDDEEEVVGTTYSDYYIECASVSGGGLDAQACAIEVASMNSFLTQYVYKSVTQSDAIEYFNDNMDDLAIIIAELGWRPNEPLIYKFVLKKTVNGQTVKSATITVSKDGSITVS